MLKNLRRRAAVFIVALTALAAGSAVAATPAHAAYSNCYFICAYTDSGGNGSQWTLPAILNSCQSVPGGWNDVISSAYNTASSWRVTFYSEAGCWGIAHTFWPGNSGSVYPNDSTSSWKIFT